MTITEALAEIKTLVKRIQSKREFIETYQFRIDSLKDPLDKDGGSAKAVSEAQQAVSDLEKRIVLLRSKIAEANSSNTITLEGTELSIENWLIWRREIAPGQERFLNALATRLNNARSQILGQKVSWGGTKTSEDKQVDLVVNLDEAKLNSDKEKIKNILGQLDGQLSLKNATIQLAA